MPWTFSQPDNARLRSVSKDCIGNGRSDLLELYLDGYLDERNLLRLPKRGNSTMWDICFFYAVQIYGELVFREIPRMAFSSTNPAEVAQM
jgi:hypothetical protein